MHDRERALGVGTGDGGGEREVGAQPVVAHVVVELQAHAEEPFAGAQLEHGAQLDGDGVVAARGNTIARRRSRAWATGRSRVDARCGRAPGPTPRRVTLTDSGESTTRVGGGRAVVVGVAAVAAVD